LRDEERHGLGRFPQGIEIDIFVEAVHRGPARTEAKAWDAVVQAIESRVGERGENEVFDGASIDRIIGFRERGFRFCGILQFVALRQTAAAR
jgi:hypothetical protein